MSPPAPRPTLDWRVAIAGGAVAALGLAGFALARDGDEAPTPEPIQLRTTVLPEPITVPEAEDDPPTDDVPGPTTTTAPLPPAPPAPPAPPPPVTAGQVAPAPAPAPAPPDDADDSPDDDVDDSVDTPD